MSMEIKGIRNPPAIRMEWPDLIGREPYVIYNEQEAVKLSLQLIEALRVFGGAKPIVRQS